MSFANFANLRFFEYFAVTYFREFRDLAIFFTFCVNNLGLLGYFQDFRENANFRKLYAQMYAKQIGNWRN